MKAPPRQRSLLRILGLTLAVAMQPGCGGRLAKANDAGMGARRVASLKFAAPAPAKNVERESRPPSRFDDSGSMRMYRR